MMRSLTGMVPASALQADKYWLFLPGGWVLQSIKENGYGGRLWAVNPRGTDLLGLPSYPSIATLSEGPDLAIIRQYTESSKGLGKALRHMGRDSLFEQRQGNYGLSAKGGIGGR